MTLYWRFLHIETEHFPLVLIETLVTAATFIIFLVLPSRFLRGLPIRGFREFAQRRLRACLLVFLLSIFGRVALLPIEPFPPPRIQDEFSYLLASETFAHGRLTNPTPPQWHHFEAFHVLLQPTYMSKYGVAPALFMAFGERLFGSPRVGVLLSMALAAASLCWMLQALLPAEWALLGGLLAVIRISWFSYFGNSYWGGSVALLGGCLLVGAGVRLPRRPTIRDGLLLALALLLLANSRPFEGALISFPVCLYTLWGFVKRRRPLLVLLPGAALFLVGALGTAYYCHRVTGRFTFPWVAHWQRWGMCPPFLFGKPNLSVHYEFPEQLIYNRDGDMFPYSNLRTPADFLAELIAKGIYQWLFFIFPALTICLLGLIPTLRSRKMRPLIYSLGLACIGFAAETWLQAHYFAVVAGILYLILINGLRWMRVKARKNVVWLKLMQGVIASVIVMAMIRLVAVPTDGFPTWGTWMNLAGLTPAWQDVHQIMEAKPGNQLVLVRYRPDHLWVNDWIYNGYDIRSQHVVWARDSEPMESNLPLFCEFKDRQMWLLTPPEKGFVRPPDRTAPWDPSLAAQFLKPIPSPQSSDCDHKAAAGIP